MNTSNYDLGVIIGRFQVPELHDSHRKLFDFVFKNHKKVICIIGLSPLKTTLRNPLDFIQRKAMLEEEYPQLTCLYVKDVWDDGLWSKSLDGVLSDNMMPGQKPLLYGSRDSFIKVYSGRHDTYELESDSFISGTEIRKQITRSMHSSKDFRMGACWSAANHFPVNYTCVDVAIMRDHRSKLLLARKSDENLYRFVGGFTDPTSESIEADAQREVLEESGLYVDKPKYIASMRIDDWRYRSEVDKICTTFWVADVISGAPIAGDDVCEVRWFDMATLTESQIMVQHRHLFRALKEYMEPKVLD